MTFDELDEQQTKAALYVLELADIEPTRENARLYLAWDVLSFTEDAPRTLLLVYGRRRQRSMHQGRQPGNHRNLRVRVIH